MVSIQKKFSWMGIGLGLCFPSMAFAIDLYVKHLPFSWESLAIIHLTNPLHFIIDSAPLVLGGVFFGLGRMIVQREKALHLINETTHDQLLAVQQALRVIKLGGALTEIPKNAHVQREIYEALQEFGEEMQAYRYQTAQQQWLHQSLATLNEMARALDEAPEEILPNILSAIVGQVNAQKGAIFLVRDDVLLPEAAYGCHGESFWTQSIPLGDGLIGQSWREGESRLITDLPEGYSTVLSGLGQASPRAILISPLKHRQQVVGVMELGFLATPPAHIPPFIEKVAEILAHSLHDWATVREGTRYKM